MSKIILYGFERCPSCRSIFVLAKLLGLEYQLNHIDTAKSDQHQEEFLKINPAHSVPVLNDNGFILWDSHAVATYLASKYGKSDDLYPKTVEKRAIVDQMLHFDNGTLMPKTLQYFLPQFVSGTVPIDKEADFRDKWQSLERILAKNNAFVCGDKLTVADMCIISTVHVAIACQFDVDKEYPAVGAWIKRFKKAVPFFDEVNIKGQEEVAVRYRSHFK